MFSALSGVFVCSVGFFLKHNNSKKTNFSEYATALERKLLNKPQKRSPLDWYPLKLILYTLFNFMLKGHNDSMYREEVREQNKRVPMCSVLRAPEFWICYCYGPQSFSVTGPRHWHFSLTSIFMHVFVYLKPNMLLLRDTTEVCMFVK